MDCNLSNTAQIAEASTSKKTAQKSISPYRGVPFRVKKGWDKMNKNWFIILFICIILTGCSSQPQESNQPQDTTQTQTGAQQPASEGSATNETADPVNTGPSFNDYKKIEVDGGDMSGHRKASVVVDIGFGNREYWAFTNEYGQLVKVTAKEIILQDDATEHVTSDGRYYNNEANVPGTEREDMDQGHVIADSLGGVSNAYNITPQESTLNRHGDQAYMEKVIRDAGGCTNFEAIITYSNTSTQIPSHYHYTYTINGNVITEDFNNVNPDEVNKSISDESRSSPPAQNNPPAQSAPAPEIHDIASIDTNGNGQVTISEAKAAGFKMPITKDHWLYKYMDDRDGDGMVGE